MGAVGAAIDVAALVLGLLAFRKTWLVVARPVLSRRRLFWCSLLALIATVGAGAALSWLLGVSND
jgi:hypothetical protein